MLVAFLDFLNSREKALLFWLIVIAAIVARGAKGSGLGRSINGILWSVTRPKLLAVFLGVAVYSAVVLFAARWLGLWDTSATKETVYWFFGTGVVLAGGAIQAFLADPTFFKRLPGRALRLTLIVEFLVNLYVFPLGVEIVLVGIFVALVPIQVVPQADPRVRAFANAMQVAIGAGLLIWVAVSALVDLDGLLTRENGEKLLLAPTMTLALIPFLYLVAWAAKRDDQMVRRRFSRRFAA
jgi:hypothetical protein